MSRMRGPGRAVLPVMAARSLAIGLAVAAAIGAAGCSARGPSTAGSHTAPAISAGPGSAGPESVGPGSTGPQSTGPGSTGPADPSPTKGAPTTPRPGPTPAAPGVLKVGSSGPAVVHLQQQLTELGYWLGAADGRFGSSTQQAVFAVQKAAGLRPTGTVGTATQAALDARTAPTARSRSGHVIEVDLARDLLLFVTDGHVDHALNTSTGGGYVYYDQGRRNVATTPKGHFTTYRVIDAPHRSSLGLLIRPRYFTGGYAIHGDDSVPAQPVSHGCVRVSNAAIDWIWAANLDPIGTPVWIY